MFKPHKNKALFKEVRFHIKVESSKRGGKQGFFKNLPFPVHFIIVNIKCCLESHFHKTFLILSLSGPHNVDCKSLGQQQCARRILAFMDDLRNLRG